MAHGSFKRKRATADRVRSLHAPSPTLARRVQLSLSRTHPFRPARLASDSSSLALIAHERLFPFAIRLLSSSCHADHRSPSFRAAHVALGPSQGRRSRPRLCWEGLQFYIDQSLILYVFLYLLLLQTSCSLFWDSLFYFGPFTISDTAPLTPHPYYLCIHRSGLDHISVNSS
jgi:hypothetical protein